MPSKDKEETAVGVWDSLSRDFTDDEVEWRVGQCGIGSKGVWAKVLCYLTARAIMNRLDATVGPTNWTDEYRNITTPKGVGVICRLSIQVGDTWVSHEDGADFTDIESTKGGISDALKRAAVKFGMGRHLYNLGETWASNIQKGYAPSDIKSISIVDKKKGIEHWCVPPKLGTHAPPPPPQEPDKTAPDTLIIQIGDMLEEASQLQGKTIDDYMKGILSKFKVDSIKELTEKQANKWIAGMANKKKESK